MSAETPAAKPAGEATALTTPTDTPGRKSEAPESAGIPEISTQPRVPFSVNEVRLTARQWFAALTVFGFIMLVTPWLWGRLQHFDAGPDYRIPYQLSKDYWLYRQRLRQVTVPGHVIVLGDSVVWGEYVAPDGTLSHFLNQETGATNRFINGGVNGLFPLAEEGLLTYYGGPLRREKVILQCNVLWMTSPKADLSAEKEEQFNHAQLVPQFFPRIPSYRADANERLSIVVQREVPFLQWVGHLQDAYFGQRSILSWILEDDGGSPPRYPNSCRDPLAQITLVVPSSPAADPLRGPKSPRHKPWSMDNQGTTHFDWVPLDASLQWHAFQRVVGRLRDRGNEILVVVGPFNEHIMAENNRPAFQKVREGVATWLRQNHVPTVVPETLPSLLYADASHPLTEGYALLAKRLCADETFRTWLGGLRN